MTSDLLFYKLLLVTLFGLCIMAHVLWPSQRAVTHLTPAKPPTPPRRRPKDPEPFAGLIRKPHCDACEHDTAPRPQVPPVAPPPIITSRGRPRQIDTAHHFCPNATCPYYGWVGLGNLSANGHPSGGPWRQFYCSQCEGYFLETHNTIFHGKRVLPELIVRVIACLAEGLGIRGTARVFEIDPHTVLRWLVEAAEQLRAFSHSILHDLQLRQVQLDELYAVLSALRTGEVSEDEAIERLSRSPHWVWTAMDPESKLLLAIDVGERTLAMAQRIVHHVAQMLAPDCAPLFLTDGFREYMTALLTHYGYWMQPPRCQAKGPAPKPRWMPRSQLLYAQVVKTTRRRRLVKVTHRVVFGTMEGVNQVLSPIGWQINTSMVERLNLSLRQHVAAIGRRATTLCKGEDGLRQQLALYRAYYNFVLPHASLRQPLAEPVPTRGTGSARQWRPCTPAMAAGLTDHVWTLKEVLLYRVPLWPQLQLR
jgi:IS1 family transposase/transposase-like protein